MAALEILREGAPERRYELSQGEIVLGRHPQCDIVLDQETVSRRHARILQKGKGVYLLEDLDSQNGTFLNGQQLKHPKRLHHNDVIYADSVALRFFDAQVDDGADTGYDLDSVPEQKQVIPPHAERRTETIGVVSVKEQTGDHGQVNAEEKLRAVLEIIHNLRRYPDTEQFLEQILESLFRIFPQADRGFVFQVEPSGNRLEPVVMKHRQMETRRIEGPPTLPPLVGSVAREVMQHGNAILGCDGGANQAAGAESVLDAEVHSHMCAPLLGPSGTPLGVLFLETQVPEHRFVHDDLDILASVARLAGQMLEHENFHDARYRAAVETAVDGIITFNEHGRIESVNPAVERLFGYSKAELVGGNVRLLMPELRRNRRLRDDGSARSQQTGEAGIIGGGRELAGRRKDGSTFAIHLSVGEFELDDHRYFTGVIHDITDRKRAEEQLQAANESLEQCVENRSGHIQLLQDVTVIANEGQTVYSALKAVLERICRYMAWPVGHADLVDPGGEGSDSGGVWYFAEPARYKGFRRATCTTELTADASLRGKVTASGSPVWIYDVTSDDAGFSRAAAARDAGLKTAFAVPVVAGTQIAAFLEFFSTETIEPEESLLEVMAHVGTQLGRVVERRRLQEELVDAVWSNQRRFGQELHDSLGQELAGIGMMVDSLRKQLQECSLSEAETATELSDMIQQARTHVRQLSKGLFPVAIDAQGLESALEELAATVSSQCQIECRFESDRLVRIQDNSVATHLFRIAQEATNNAVKHGRADRIAVSLSKDGPRVLLTVHDNGTGISEECSKRSPGIGLRTMQYRANAIGATLRVERAEAGGTLVTCAVE